MSKERTEWSLKISLTRKEPRVEAEKREKVKPEVSVETRIYRHFAGLVEEAARGGGEEYLEKLGDENVSRLLEKVPDIQDIVVALRSRHYGLLNEDLERLHLALDRYAEKTGEEQVHPGRILGAATR